MNTNCSAVIKLDCEIPNKTKRESISIFPFSSSLAYFQKFCLKSPTFYVCVKTNFAHAFVGSLRVLSFLKVNECKLTFAFKFTAYIFLFHIHTVAHIGATLWLMSGECGHCLTSPGTRRDPGNREEEGGGQQQQGKEEEGGRKGMKESRGGGAIERT